MKRGNDRPRRPADTSPRYSRLEIRAKEEKNHVIAQRRRNVGRKRTRARARAEDTLRRAFSPLRRSGWPSVEKKFSPSRRHAVINVLPSSGIIHRPADSTIKLSAARIRGELTTCAITLRAVIVICLVHRHRQEEKEEEEEEGGKSREGIYRRHNTAADKNQDKGASTRALVWRLECSTELARGWRSRRAVTRN